MPVNPEQKLKELGLQLPETIAPLANYIPYLITGNTVMISGQVPRLDGKIHHPGRLGAQVSLEDANAAARICGLNILAQLRNACDGDLNRVERCIKLGGFVAAEPDFTQHPEVINGASDLMVEVFGEAGRHTRFAVGVASLPRGCCVEIDAVFTLKANP